jgi:hypothetical protein
MAGTEVSVATTPHRPAARQGVVGLVLRIAACLTLGYLLSVYLTRADVQDALQYRLNLETGTYGETSQVGVWRLLVLGLYLVLPGTDPFTLIGGVIAAMFIGAASRIDLGALRWAAFLVMLALPLMALNYGQVLRQGLAAACLVHALLMRRTLGTTLLLIVASLLHVVYAPFVVLLLVREWILGKCANRTGINRPDGRQFAFDVMVVLGIATTVVGVLWLGPREVVEKYFEFDSDNLKRLLVSMLMLAHVVLIYPVSTSRLTVFTTYLCAMVALSLPFHVDYTRINTALFPFLLFSAMACPRPKLSYYALFICLVLSSYVGLRLQYS